MRSGVRFWGATTIALIASGAANSAHLEPAVQLPPALWSWSGGYIGGHVDFGNGQKFFSNPYGPSVYGGFLDAPEFLEGGQIGCNWQKNSWVFGVKPDPSGAVSNSTNTCLAISGIVRSANCKASPNVLSPRPVASVTLLARMATRWPTSSEAWLGKTIKATSSITTSVANVGDGALDFHKALDEVFPGTRHQRCWMHKTVNVLDKVHSLRRPL